MEQSAVLCSVGDQVEEQDHLSAASSYSSAEDCEDVLREEEASAEDSRHDEDQESEEAADTNGRDRVSAEEPGKVVAGHEETRERSGDGYG